MLRRPLSELLLTGEVEPCAGATRFHHLTVEISTLTFKRYEVASMAGTGAVCCESDLDVTSAELDRCEQLAQCRPLRTRRLPVLAHSVASMCSHVAVGVAGSSSTGWEVLCVNGSELEQAHGVQRCVVSLLRVITCSCSVCGVAVCSACGESVLVVVAGPSLHLPSPGHISHRSCL